MIRLLDEALENMLDELVPLQGAVDISFDTPSRGWSSMVTQPTLNVFMWDVRRSAHEARSGRIKAVQPGHDGERYELVAPRVQCRYHLTAWASDVRDEHRILSQVLATLLPMRTIPQKYLTGALATSKPAPDFRTATPHVKDFVDFWSALQGEMKSGIDLVVTLTMDVKTPFEPMLVGPPVAEGGPRARTEDVRHPVRRSGTAGREGRILDQDGKINDKAAVGKIVHAPLDATTVDDHGCFWINAEPGDEITLKTDPPVTAIVPKHNKITFTLSLNAAGGTNSRSVGASIRQGTVEDEAAVGKVVHAPSDASIVDSEGHFQIKADPGDRITLKTHPPQSTTVSDVGQIVFAPDDAH